MEICPCLKLVLNHNSTCSRVWRATKLQQCLCTLLSFASCLLTVGSTFTLQWLGAIVHGDSSAALRFSQLSAIRIQHPPGALASSLILHTDETRVQGQIVSDGVLEREKSNGFGLIGFKTAYL